MFRTALILLFVIKLKFSRNRNFHEYIREKYDGTALKTFRQLEVSEKKLSKADLDREFLFTCKANNCVPNFLKFKLYRKSLYNTEFYKNALRTLIDNELSFKYKRIHFLSKRVEQLRNSLKNTFSSLTFNHAKVVIEKNIHNYCKNIKIVHSKKLNNLGISPYRFMDPHDVIFNFSNYKLSDKEKSLLALGLDFKLPCYKPNFVQFFMPLEKLTRILKKFSPDVKQFEHFQLQLKNLSYSTWSSIVKTNNNWYPFFTKEDFNTIKALSKNDNIVICKPDKGKGIVILNKTDYISKMELILSDESKFVEVKDTLFKISNKSEDKINRVLKKFKDKKIITDEVYSSLYSTGSSFGILYGLPKVHKGNSVPLRPILAAYNLPNFKIAKFLVPLLTNLTKNEYTISNSYNFSSEVLDKINLNNFMASYDIESLFTNIPLVETIELVLNRLYPTADTIYFGFDRASFKELLELAIFDSHFLFNSKLYKQVDGCAMGSPLGPVLANIFMGHLESSFLEECPETFRPSFYRRYVDDTFVTFENKEQSLSFLNFINSKHPNIKFTMEEEHNKQLPFLDLMINRQDSINTSIYRKKTYTGLGSSFYSFTPLKYKISAVKTLIHRGYKLCSTWKNFDDEMKHLLNYFTHNGYSSNLFFKLLNEYLMKVFRPVVPIPTVPKEKIYIAMPFLGFNQESFSKQLKFILNKVYPFIDLHIAPVNPLKLSSNFKFKDALPVEFRSGVVYQYSCPNCKLGTYIGCTIRQLRARYSAHKGISHRTGVSLNRKEKSNIRDHTLRCNSTLALKDFKILGSYSSESSLLTAESLFLKIKSCELNSDSSSTTLYVA